MEERDLEGVFSLYETVFGVWGGQLFRNRWEWAHRSHPLPERSPKWVLVDGDRVVGFLAAMALPYLIGGKRVVANTTCDYMVHPDYRFHGIKLMREFFRASENCVTCDDMEATLKVTQWLGAKPVGPMVRYTKLLDARFLKRRGALSRVPGPLLWPVTQALRLSDGIRTGKRAAGITVTPLADFDERFDRFADSLSQQVPAMIARDSAFLKWRYGPQSPHKKVSIGAVTDDDGELAGYVVFYVSATPGDENVGHIIDIQALPMDDSKTASALMRYAVRNLLKQGAWVAYYRMLPASISALDADALKDWGFRPRGRHVFMVKMKESEIAAIAQSEASWNYSFGDSEASHILV
ncbi:MAG: GNAT family N-acetyltransferase [Chloroflexi bacterium]|nr:GNAT family N-acetyltransferase [Chloroflexota bacterium]